MKKIIKLPELGKNIKEYVLVAVNKEEGEPVKKGEVLYEVEADKVVNEIEAEDSGVMGKWLFEEGDEIKPGETIGEIEV